ncbi:MAG: thiol protease/hemagglutinin PrtT [Prevotellaceae bacterium]|jgi:hypothetical protein|nr:thiol protease/hemagglutinin PrtT [Prevotellaceae bacterium]
MKKTLIISILLFICFSNIYANPVTPEEAMQKAQNFSQNRTENSAVQHLPPQFSQPLTLAYSCRNIENFSSENPFFYVFNQGNGGFIIVSGDDRTREILGYSDSSIFNDSNIPANMRWFLSMYAGEIAALTDDYVPAPNSTPDRAPANTTAIAPLLTTQWNQDAPYYNLCPIDADYNQRSYTGCVATAIAQIMKYHNYPATGTGTHSYTLPNVTGAIFADFGATTYDWTNMKNTASQYTTQAQRNAVATLMYHCGVASEMRYSAAGSGAYSLSAMFGMINHFGYDVGMDLKYRDSYNQTQWNNFVKAELDAFRPVYYAGDDGEVGHAFVCDGYNSSNQFHINWGWGGAYDGYFSLSALDPEGQGIGGGSSGYNYGQEIITGIRPAQTHAIALSCPVLQINNPPLQTNSTGSFSFSVKNSGTSSFNGHLALVISDGYDQQVIYENNNNTVAAGQTVSFNPSQTITLPAGDYKLWLYSEDFGYLAMSRITISSGSSQGSANLVCNNLQVNGTLTTGSTGSFSFSITNNGNAAYNGYISLDILDNDRYYLTTIYENYNQYIAAGQTVNFNPSGLINVPAGNYYLAVVYEEDGYYALDYIPITVNSSQGSYNLVCNNLRVNGTLTTGSTGSFSFSITNNGNAAYNDEIVLVIYDEYNYYQIIYENYESIAAGQTVNFNPSDVITVSAGNYYLGVYGVDESGNYFEELDYIPITVNSSQGSYNLVCNNLQVNGTLTTNSTGNFSFSITNNGNAAYDDIILLQLVSVDDDYQNIYANYASIAAGATVSFNPSGLINVPAGNYTLVLAGGDADEDGYYDILDYIRVRVTNGNSFDLRLISDLTVTPNTIQVGGAFSANNVSIKNFGNGTFNGEIALLLTDNTGVQLRTFDEKTSQTFAHNAEKTYNFSFSGDTQITEGVYSLSVVWFTEDDRFWVGNGAYSNTAQLTVINSSGIDEVQSGKISIFPNPAKDFVTVDFKDFTEKIDKIIICNMQGQQIIIENVSCSAENINIPLNEIIDGVYILQIHSEKGILTEKLIVKK